MKEKLVYVLMSTEDKKEREAADLTLIYNTKQKHEQLLKAYAHD